MRKVGSIRDRGLFSRPFVASEDRDRHLFILVSLKSSQSLTSNVARIRRPFVALEPVSDVKDENAQTLWSKNRDRQLFPQVT